MSKKKIIDLGLYRKKMENKAAGESKSLNNKQITFEEKLQEFIHRPFENPGSKNELLTIFEEDQIKKDADNKKE